jgi:hypothetical protein
VGQESLRLARLHLPSSLSLTLTLSLSLPLSHFLFLSFSQACLPASHCTPRDDVWDAVAKGGRERVGERLGAQSTGIAF